MKSPAENTHCCKLRQEKRRKLPPPTLLLLSLHQDPTPMPGTIQVSVVDLMDLPSEANTHPLSLKVAMGKREHQTTGKGDFSFPVVSLRENLILTLHDTEGNVVSLTEFKTMSVVEKGIWDDLFPLEGGGCVHMKLQFSLSKEERKRIREVRYSALKKKHGELLKGDLKSSLSEQNFGGALINQLEHTDLDECVNPLETPSLQKLEERSVDSFEQVVPHLTEANKGTIKIQPPPDGTQERHISSEKCLDPHVGCSFTSAEMEEDQIHRPKGKNLLQRSSSSNVRKMISTFENNISQGLSPHVGSRTKHQLSKIDIGDTLKMVPSKESNMKEVKSPQTMAKSFSAETLSEINIQQNPNLFRSLAVNKQEDMVHFDHDTRWETSRKNNQILDFKTDQNFKNLESCKQKAVKVKDDEGSSVDTLSIPRAHNSKGTTTVLRSTETEEAASLDGSAEHVNEREDPVPIDLGKGPSIMSMHGDFNSFQKKIELDAFTKGGFSLEARAPCGTSDATPSPHNSEEPEALGAEDNPIDEANRSGDKMDDGIGTIEQIVTNYFQLSHEVNIELVHKEENKNEEHTLLEEDQLSRKMLHESVYIDEPCSRYTYHSAVINGTDGRCCRSHSDEQTVSGSSNETVELSTYSDYEKCPFRSLGIWIPRYLCTTTGSKQLRNLTECCNICVPVEKNLSSMEANEKQKMHDDISIEVNKNEKISYSSEKLNLENHLAFQNYGGLVERGVRIIIIMAASGTILFNTRQKKPR